MHGDIAVGPRGRELGSWSRALLVGLGAAALATPGMILAQEDNAITLPEVKVIATTPISAPRPRASQPEPMRQPATPPAASAATRDATPAPTPPSQPATPPPAPPSQPAAVDPSLIERDKVPSNVQTLTATDFDHAKAPSFLEALSQSLPGVSLGDQTGNEFQRAGSPPRR